MPKNEEHLTLLLEGMCVLTCQLQEEMSHQLIQNDAVREQVKKDNDGSENIAIEKMNRAMLGVISQMPLASLNSVNLIMNIIAHHSKITGDPTMSRILKKIGSENATEEIKDE